MLAWLAKIGIGSIVGKIADAYVDLEKARNDRERIVAEQRIKTLEARRDVMIAEAGGFSINAMVRLLFAVGPLVYYAKIFVWDKTLGWGVTDPLSAELSEIAFTIIGFYFLTEVALCKTLVRAAEYGIAAHNRG